MHVPFCFKPDEVGGTEVYVEALAREQQRSGIRVVIAAPSQSAEHYECNGLEVYRFGRAHDSTDLRALYGARDDLAARGFGDILDCAQPDVVHLHAFTPAVSTGVANEVKKRGIGLVFTYHTPTVSCARGTLLRWGDVPCDGTLRVHTCARCTLHGLGVGRPTAMLLGSAPTTVGAVVGQLGLHGGVWTALRMTELLDIQHTAMRSYFAQPDRIVVLCEWAGHVLRRNGVPGSKIVLSRHGLAPHPGMRPGAAERRASGPLRVSFLGRLHPTKGVDVLVRAVRALPGLELEVDIFGLIQDEASAACAGALRRIAAGDKRIRFHDPVPAGGVPDVLRQYDILAVPSRWLETGPLVVLEAFAAGVPILGSRLGGIAELVHDGIDGLLVEPDSIAEWSRALRRLACEPDLVQRLRQCVRPPKRMSAVAAEMLAVYEGL